jgi:tetratricopeptide (TPR) repeat protein
MRRIGLLDTPDIPTWAAAALLGVDLAEAGELLEQLVDARLLEPRGRDRLRHRYHCHDLIHAYALERAIAEETPDERLAARTRAFGGWLCLAERAQHHRWGGDTGLHGTSTRWWPVGWYDYAGYDSPLACVADERLALSAVVAQSAELGLAELCWELAWTCVSLYESRGCFDEWLRTCGQALAATDRAGNSLGMAAMLRALAERFSRLHAHDDARWLAEESARLFTANDDAIGYALARQTLAVIDMRTGQPARALAGFTRTLAVFREFGLRSLEADALCGMALAHVERHDYPAAESGLEQAGRIVDRINSSRGRAQVLRAFGELRLHQGVYEQAQQSFERLLLLARRTGERYGEAVALVGLGEALAAQRTTQRAEDSLRRARVMARRVGDRLLEGRALLVLGGLDITRNRTTAATTNLNQSAAIFEQLRATGWHRRATDALSALEPPVPCSPGP